jgi:hypothetical protein
MSLALPEPVGRGKVKAERRARYNAELAAWCDALLELKAGIEHTPGVREWCYLLEPHGLSKGDFDRAEELIGDCRKKGLLPLDFTTDASESKWAASNVEVIHADPEAKAEGIVAYIEQAEAYYHPVSFWDFQANYVEVLVEKSSLKSLGNEVCAEYAVPCSIAGGSWSINQRAAIIRRLERWQDDGKQCVLLYCGDHDPHGLRISTALRNNLAEVAEVHFPDFDLDEVVIERFGLNADFINNNGLTWIEGLITGSGKNLADPKHRHNGHHDVQAYIAEFGERKVEAEALVVRPDEGRQLFRDAILKYLDDDGVDEFLNERAELRREMRDHLDELLKR